MLRRLQYHVDLQVTSLSPGSAECSMALHEAMRETSQEPEASSGEVLRRIDSYIASIRGRRRGLVSFPFWIVENVVPIACGFRPPFSTMSREERRWLLRSRVLRPHFERAKAANPALADLMYQMGDITHALVSMAFFTTGRGQAQVGYIAPDARARLQPDIAVDRPPKGADVLPFPSNGNDPVGKKPLSQPSAASTLLAPRIGTPGPESAPPAEVDYCIVGSGAAGGILAYRLGAAIGKNSSICVLERGGYYTPHADFSDDEMRMISLLYAEGGLQMTRSFDFTVLQGECVGGTTVINNAVCFRMPDIARHEWKDFGIDTDALETHYDKVAAEINIAPVSDVSLNTRAQALFTTGVEKYNASLAAGTPLGMGSLSPVDRNSGNFLNCLGCGHCNIGCRYMRKLSVLETYIPWAQAEGIKVLSGVAAVQCDTETAGGKKRVTGVIVRTRAGGFRRIRIRKSLIVAGGAIASSRFLLRSGVGGDGVGKSLSCNFAVPPLVEFPEAVNAFDGLQMALFAFPKSHDAVFETTFNPPGSFAIAVPLYMRKHAELMAAFTRTVNFTALVASDPAGLVSGKRDLLFGRAIEWAQTPNDIQRIKMAMATVIRIAQAAGARRVYLPTHPVLDVPLGGGSPEAIIKQMDRVLNDRKFFNFVTAHPQGGNLMADESFRERVIDLDFRVRDCDNLFVCDASVFPRGVRVNPQWTIMALASAAGERIAQTT
jgi:choline dehydrogenase-like flavoprotein